MKPSQYKWTIVDDVIIAVGTAGKLPDEPWKAFVNDLHMKPVKKYLAVIIGTVEVSSVQRKICIDAINRRGIKAAVVNDSSVVRGIITAASWFSVDVTSYSPAQLREAVRGLGVPEYREDAVINAVDQLRASVA